MEYEFKILFFYYTTKKKYFINCNIVNCDYVLTYKLNWFNFLECFLCRCIMHGYIFNTLNHAAKKSYEFQ